MLADEAKVLRWLVDRAEIDPSLGRMRFSVSEAEARSPVGILSNAEFSQALAALKSNGLIRAEAEGSPANPFAWSTVYPTGTGMIRVSDTEQLKARSQELLAALLELKSGAIFTLKPHRRIHLGGLSWSSAEILFLLTYLKGMHLLKFNEDQESGNTVVLFHLTVTEQGRRLLTPESPMVEIDSAAVE